MKPEEILSGILDTIEKQSIKTKDGEKHLIQENFIPEKYSESIRKYLVEPYENGFWEIESEWNYYSDFHKEIISQTKILPDINNFDKNKEEFFKFINENNNEQDKRNLIRILKDGLHKTNPSAVALGWGSSPMLHRTQDARVSRASCLFRLSSPVWIGCSPASGHGPSTSSPRQTGYATAGCFFLNLDSEPWCAQTGV